MENNLENRSKFFVQYWCQKVLYVGGVGLEPIGTKGWNLNHPDFFLQLKPLSAISDEDAIELFNIEGFCNLSAVKYERKGLSGFWLEWSLKTNPKFKRLDELTFYQADFLRSRGYALPYCGLSVEDQEKYGWIKLTSSPDNQ